ncbi:ATPase associated with various cellular activities family protein [Methyloversatilis sp. RAC08]|uniref:ExeA family protein n=1 Tax=Methyloversatilis sp. RAC08 TaxID=1842540 RepID=UPI00083DE9D6|nr:AAA family ATPase [Methyloversatilis sp. RAC08]AOF83443.1 ATPase associated with various cellular activities family protein [Methyloversatilis sp. RAC08]
MYLEHFGLRESPFRITPHADFFFGGANRRALLDALVYALGREEGLVKVSGEVGTGKTMLARVLIDHLPAHLRAIYLADPLMNRGELLAVLADELGCAPATGSEGSAHRLLRAVQEALVAEFAAGRQIVLLIDEAHAMPAETLEQIRLLSNLESERHKLIKIALFGQPELDDLLARTDMRQLKDRITQHFRLDPLQPDDVGTYIDFRMRAAGYRGPNVFDAAAVTRIARDSGGLTRRINILADKALLAAFARGAHGVTAADAARAFADTELRVPAPGGVTPTRLGLAVAASVALLATGFLLGRNVERPTAETSLRAATAGGMAAAPVTERAPEPPPTATSETDQTTPPAAAVAEPPALPVAALPDAIASAPPAAAPEPVVPPPTPADDLTSLLASSKSWTTSAPDDRWFIQLISAPAAQGEQVERYVRRARRTLDAQQLRAYRADTAGGTKLAVIYGDFPDQRSAQQALATLPDWIATARPIARPVRSLRQP